MRFIRSLGPVLVTLTLSTSLHAQLGDLAEEGKQPQPEATRHFAIAPVLTAPEEQKTFQIPAGFRLELVADESLVQDPAAAAYDWNGNLWICQDTRYNAALIAKIPTLAGGAASVPSGKVVRLESSRHDGHYDRRVVWLDGLNQPRGIAILRDGVVIADPPNLWLTRDTKGTGQCDEKILLATSYGVPGSEEESGSLLWGRDNILRNISASYDYRYAHGAITERLAVPVRGQFGITQDDYGRLFYALNSDQLRGDLFAPEYATRNPALPVLPLVDAEIAMSQEAWPSHPTPAINRAYRKGSLGNSTGGLRDDGTLLECTAATGALIYRGTNFPAKYYGNAFVCEAAANLIKRNLLLESEGRITAVNAVDGQEFITSTDSRFRPVALLNAPDGSLLIVDFYRGLLEGYTFVTSYLHEQVLKRGLDRPLFGLGRIWKLTYEGGPLGPMPDASQPRDTAQLVRLLDAPNAWWRDAAQQELVERGDPAAVPALANLFAHASNPVTRVYALWSLDGLHATTPARLREALRDPSPKVRVAAVRLHEAALRSADAETAVAQLAELAHDAAPEVTVQLALSLGEAKTTSALELSARLLLEAGDHPYLPKAIASGLTGREAAFFELLASRLKQTPPRPELKAMLATLAEAIAASGTPPQVAQVIAQLGDSHDLPKWARLAVLRAWEVPPPGKPIRRAQARRSLTSGMFSTLTTSADEDVRAASSQVALGLARVEKELAAQVTSARPLNAEEQKRYEAGRTVFQICAACHQPGGTGLPHVAPSLVDSQWVPGHPEVLARIVLDGKEGTPGFPSTMPPIGGTLTDEQIASVLTYIRNSWGLHYGAVSAESVAKARREITQAHRQGAWTDSQLTKVVGRLARGWSGTP